jgi:hypothetical protein
VNDRLYNLKSFNNNLFKLLFVLFCFFFSISVFSSKEDLFYPFPSLYFFLCHFSFFLIFNFLGMGFFFSFLFAGCGHPRDFVWATICHFVIKKSPNQHGQKNI